MTEADSIFGTELDRLKRLLAVGEEESRTDSEKRVATTASLHSVTERAGGQIGRYKLLRVLGEGGMGIVYLAEQEEPVKRQVALKVIKPGMDSKQVIARFDAEQQALALMDHPHIAQVYDAGLAPSGRPYFVMEYVKGIPVTEHCDKYKLTIEERLHLFLHVCEAIRHAHQKGIIHRDLKPSNILVTIEGNEAIPKVIDFGVARAISQPLTERTLYTEQGQLVGTPEYMSPEQVEMSNQDIDTRADIYSLGVVLYELIAGVLPFDPQTLREGGFDHIRKVICEEDPKTPSTRLSKTSVEESAEFARRRRTSTKALQRKLHGDLDWITLKAMEKDRTRRYGSAGEFAADIVRHLNDEPVTAGRPSVTYRLGKFVRRHRVVVAAGAVVAVVLVLGSLVSTWEAIQATRAQREQSRLRLQAEAQGLFARQNAYAADMSLAQQALDASNLGRAVDLLNRHRPRPGEQDLRGWEWRYLWQFCQSDAEFTLCEFPEAVRSIGVSPDGKWLALYGHHGMARLWDIAARKEIAPIQEGGAGMFGGLVSSPRGDLLALSADKGVVRLWDVRTRTDRAHLQCPDWPKPLAFSADGKRLATLAPVASSEWEVALWDVDTARLVTKFTAKVDIELWQGRNTLSSDGGFVAIGGRDGRIRLWETETGKELLPPISAYPENITALAISPDESLLASGAGYSDTTIKLWEVKSGNQVACLRGHTDMISGLVFSPDGKMLASASADQTIRLWDVEKKQPVGVLRGHRSGVLSVAFLLDGKTLVSGDADGEVCFWSTRPKPRQESFVMRPISFRVDRPASLEGGRVSLIYLCGRNAAFSMDSKSFVTLDRDGMVVRWDMATVEPVGALTALGASNDAMLFSPDGRLLVVMDSAGVIKVWDWVGQRLTTSFVGHSMEPSRGQASLWAFTSDGRILVSGTATGTVKLWDVASWKAVADWQMMHAWAWSAALSLDGRTLFTGHQDGTVAVTDLATGRELQAIPAHKGNVGGLASSPDGRLMASASNDGLIVLWDTATRKELARLRRGFQEGANSISFSPDGRRLAIGKSDKEVVKVWDLVTQREVLTLPGQGRVFCYTKFSPDGNMILAISDEGNLHLWRAPSFAQIDAIEKGKTTDR
jgi:WD40 repeat protein/serine/threonine protein kinase